MRSGALAHSEYYSGADLGSYVTDLGGLATEIWHSQLGIATFSGFADTWTGQLLGTVVQAVIGDTTTRPAYAPDASFTTGLSALQFDGVNDTLRIVNGPTIQTVARPGWILVGRLRAAPATQQTLLGSVDNPVTSTIPSIYKVAGGALAADYFPTGSVNTGATLIGTTAHFMEARMRASDNKAVVSLDTVDTVGSGSAAISVSLKSVYFGNDRGANYSQLTLHMAILLKDEASPAQRAAVYRRARVEFGF